MQFTHNGYYRGSIPLNLILAYAILTIGPYFFLVKNKKLAIVPWTTALVIFFVKKNY